MRGEGVAVVALDQGEAVPAMAEGEAQALGLSAAASRTALFIGGLIIKRLASNKSDRVSLNLTAVGFVPSVRPLPGRPIPLLDAN